MKHTQFAEGSHFSAFSLPSVQGVHSRGVQEAADTMIQDLQLGDKRNTPSRNLSGGMKRKLRSVSNTGIYVHACEIHTLKFWTFVQHDSTVCDCVSCVYGKCTTISIALNR